MSITVRRWSEEELKEIKEGKNNFLATIFMNRKTFSKKELNYYPHHLRKIYDVYFDIEGEEDELITVYATDDTNLLAFLEEEYDINNVVEINEVMTKTRRVK